VHLDAAGLLARYDAQLRTHLPERLPEGVTVERDGPLLRFLGPGVGFVSYRDLGGLEGSELDELIARQVRIFAERSEPFEWKLHGHDRPTDLAERLIVMGFIPEDEETVVIAPVGAIAGEVTLPHGVTLREANERFDLDRIGAMEEAVWHDGRGGWLADRLDAEHAADPDAMTIVIAEADDAVVCAGWVRFMAGTEFATLWGGGTLPAWRGHGIYRAVVAHRANLAAQRGSGFLQVDASADSRPILERLGFVSVTTTTPFVWAPPAAP
jgi:GNAT superfamily N-acetyltransferase